MAIENRNLEPGTVLTARYKGETYTLEVIGNEDGKPRYVLASGETFKSPSAAGAHITGKACNGWKFWSLQSEVREQEKQQQQAQSSAAATKSKPTKQVKLIKKVPNQQGVPEGSVKYFCSSCMESFVHESTDEPEACPENHAKYGDKEMQTVA